MHPGESPAKHDHIGAAGTSRDVMLGKSKKESSDIDGFTEIGDVGYTELKAELHRLRAEQKRGGRTQTVLISVLVGLTFVGVCLGAAAFFLSDRKTTCRAAVEDASTLPSPAADQGSPSDSSDVAARCKDPEQWTLASPSERFGPEDEIGAANYLTGLDVSRLGKYAGEGSQAFSLAVDVRYTDGQGVRQCVSKVKYTEAEGPYGECGYDDYFLPCFTGVGTHIDGLAHYGKNNVLYNGVDALDNVESFPIQNRAYLPDRQGNVGTGEPDLMALNETLEHQQLKKLGTDQIPPIVTRGVVIDLVPVYSKEEKGEIDGVAYVLGGTVITPEKIQEALDLQGMTLESGDAALIHTGWANLFRKDKGAFLAENPGLGVDAARFLTCHEVVLVGIDQWGTDVRPPISFLHQFPVHQHLLYETGTYIIEYLDLSALVAAGIHESMFILGAAKYVAGVNVNVNPIAVGIPTK